MAVAEMKAICREAEKRHGARCLMAHRTGPVAVGEASVVVATSAPGRRAALDACAWAVEEMKARVPVWKLQRFADGGTEWSEGS
jgi:molybdopterin synthase catalytic subunit